MIARRDPAHALGEQHPLEPARPATTARPDPLALHARYADAPAPVPAPTRPRSGLRIPWAVFPAAAVLGTGLHYAARIHPALFAVAATVTFAGAFWWFNRWALEGWEETKRERGW